MFRYIKSMTLLEWLVVVIIIGIIVAIAVPVLTGNAAK